MNRKHRLVGLMTGSALAALLSISSAESNWLFDSKSDQEAASVVERALNAAKAARQNGDLDGAAAKLAYLVSMAPDNADVLAEYGKVLTEMGRPDDALIYYKRALAKNSDDWRIYNAEAVAYDEKHDFDASAADYAKALKLAPGETAILNNAARSRMMAGDLKGAETLLAQAGPTATRDGYLIDTQSQLSALEVKSGSNAPVAALTPDMAVKAPAVPPAPTRIDASGPPATIDAAGSEAAPSASSAPLASQPQVASPAPPAAAPTTPVEVAPAKSMTAAAQEKPIEPAPVVTSTAAAPSAPSVASTPTLQAMPAVSAAPPQVVAHAEASAPPAAPPTRDVVPPAPPVVAPPVMVPPEPEVAATPASSPAPVPVVQTASAPSTPSVAAAPVSAPAPQPVVQTVSTPPVPPVAPADTTRAIVTAPPAPQPVMQPASAPPVAPAIATTVVAAIAPAPQPVVRAASAPPAPQVAPAVAAPAMAPAAPAPQPVAQITASAAAPTPVAIPEPPAVVAPAAPTPAPSPVAQPVANPEPPSAAPARSPEASTLALQTPPAAPVAHERVFIRVGTYRSHAFARRVAARLRLKHEEVHVAKLKWQTTFYRVYIADVGEQPEARLALDSIHSLGYRHARLVARMEEASPRVAGNPAAVVALRSE